jgi:hypothetical protein
MSLKIIIILVLFSITNCFGQNEMQCEKNNDSISSYYKYCYEAEDKIIAKDYKDAIDLYRKAFAYNVPFEFDLKNAMQVAFQEKDSSAIIQFMKIYLRKSSKNLKEILKESDSKTKMPYAVTTLHFWKEIKNQLDTVKSKVDTSILADLETLLEKDQEIRKICHKQYGDYFYEDNEGKERIMKVDSINLITLIDIYNKYGSIAEKEISNVGVHCIEIIVLHNGAWGKDWLNNILKKEVIKGNFPAKVYAKLIDSQTFFKTKLHNKKDMLDCYYCENEGLGYGNTYLIRKFNNSYEEIQKRRESIYLEDYEKSRKKIGWTFIHKKSQPFSFGYLSLLGGFTDKDAQKRINYYKSNNIEYYMFKR